jgi:hypothetical protein
MVMVMGPVGLADEAAGGVEDMGVISRNCTACGRVWDGAIERAGNRRWNGLCGAVFGGEMGMVDFEEG